MAGEDEIRAYFLKNGITTSRAARPATIQAGLTTDLDSLQPVARQVLVPPTIPQPSFFRMAIQAEAVARQDGYPLNRDQIHAVLHGQNTVALAPMEPAHTVTGQFVLPLPPPNEDGCLAATQRIMQRTMTPVPSGLVIMETAPPVATQLRLLEK